MKERRNRVRMVKVQLYPDPAPKLVLLPVSGTKQNGHVNGVQNGLSSVPSGLSPSQEEETAVPAYMADAEEVDFPTMPFDGYQGYRYLREMEHYDAMIKEKQKSDMIKMGLNERVAEEMAEIATAKRVEAREKREVEDNGNQTYQDAVDEAKEEELMAEENSGEVPKGPAVIVIS